MDFQIPNFLPASAELFQAGVIVALLLVISFCRRATGAAVAYWVSLVTLLALATYHIATIDAVDFTFGKMFFDDPVGDVIKCAACLCVALALIYGRRYLRDRDLDSPEYYLIIMLATLGICVLVSAGSLITVYLGLELLSLSSYALVAVDRDSVRSTEAAMKYFVLGALASGLLLYGMSMIYGATQTLDIVDIARALSASNPGPEINRTVLLFGLVFLVAGLAFKLGVVPFHMWIPDVYEGAPTAVTLFIASAPKLAAFAMAYRLLVIGMWDLSEYWQRMLLIVGVASIVLGNVTAIAQTNLKRMLAYSGISHMGFMVLGLVCGRMAGVHNWGGYNYNAYSSSLFYALTYAVTALATFGVILLLSRQGFESERIEDFKGLNKRSSWWAGMMAILMFSMAGIPFFVGFFAKFYILHTLISAGYLWVAVVAVLASLVGAFYYLRVVKVMFFDEATDLSPIGGSTCVKGILSFNSLLIAALGLFPDVLMHICAVLVGASL
ncbi:NADH-quinone oxidoreductase subunit NuoN [Uliginosibacterium gangwonense]|uniref:NADH-quinone oxidoreductase subunit NuoN n=1 Tax=Uliginosibacterium gangwonense TaxID=392736 RepID=UPI0003A294C1|nr:NADH-quinone oxidoreductase subunit NuoN [Uliginosibacterium gangwonense]